MVLSPRERRPLALRPTVTPVPTWSISPVTLDPRRTHCRSSSIFMATPSLAKLKHLFLVSAATDRRMAL